MLEPKLMKLLSSALWNKFARHLSIPIGEWELGSRVVLLHYLVDFKALHDCEWTLLVKLELSRGFGDVDTY